MLCPFDRNLVETGAQHKKFWIYHKKTLRHANKGLMYKNGNCKKKKAKRETKKG